MALPIRKFAEQCEASEIVNGRITSQSSPRVTLNDISHKWRQLRRATDFKRSGKWSEKEERAAEVIMTSLTYLRRIGCKDIEMLLREMLERRLH